MANLTREQALRYLSTTYGTLELLSHLLQHPADDYLIGPESDTPITVSNSQVRDLVHEYQRAHLPETQQVRLDSQANLTTLYQYVLAYSLREDTNFQDQETRESLVNAYRLHLRELQDRETDPRIQIPKLSEQIRAAQAYHRQEQLLASRVNQTLTALTNASIPEAARNYVRLNQAELSQDLVESLTYLDTRDPSRVSAQVSRILDQAARHSHSWATLNALMLTRDLDQPLRPVAQAVASLVANENLNPDATRALTQAESTLKSAYQLQRSQARANIIDSIESWQKLNGLDRGGNDNFTEEVIDSIRANVIRTAEKRTLLAQFRGKLNPEAVVREAILRGGLDHKYNLSQVDVDRLTEFVVQTPGFDRYYRSMKDGLREKGPSLVKPLPLSTVGYISTKAKVDPVVVQLFSLGYQDSSLVQELKRQGYSRQEINSQLDNLNVYFGQGNLIDGIYQLNFTIRHNLGRLSQKIEQTQYNVSVNGFIANRSGLHPGTIQVLRQGGSARDIRDFLRSRGYTNAQIIQELEHLKAYSRGRAGFFGSFYKLRLGADQVVARVRFALRPENIPVIRNILHAYLSVTDSIRTGYGHFLKDHRNVAFFLSGARRLEVWHSIVDRLVASKNVPSWIRLGFSFYQGGGYTRHGFRIQFGRFVRVKTGNWLISRGAKFGADKLLGKFMVWVGGGLVAGTLSGGVGFAIQAGIWLARAIGKTPKIAQNADVYAAWAIKNLAGIAALMGTFGPTLLGGFLGLLAGLGLFLFGFIGGWAILGLVAIGAGLGYLLGNFGAISSAIGTGLSSLGASMGAWWAGFLQSGNAVSGTVLGTVGLTVGTAVFSIFNFNNALYTSEVGFKEAETFNPEAIMSQYVAITISPSATSLPAGTKEITYTITITAKQDITIGNSITLSFVILGDYISETVDATVNVPTTTLTSGQSITLDPYTFTSNLIPTNAIVTATAGVTVTAPAADQATSIATTSIGDTSSIASLACFNFTGGWGSQLSVMQGIIGTIIAKHPVYVATACRGKTIELRRVNQNPSWGAEWVTTSIVEFYDKGVNLYTMAHELGHGVDYNTGISTEFRNQGLVVWSGNTCQNNIYPVQQPSLYFISAPSRCYSENFAEGGAYIIMGKGLPATWSSWFLSTGLFGK